MSAEDGLLEFGDLVGRADALIVADLGDQNQYYVTAARFTEAPDGEPMLVLTLAHSANYRTERHASPAASRRVTQ